MAQSVADRLLDVLSAVMCGLVRSDDTDLSARGLAILLAIATMPGPHTVRGMAERLAISRPAITRTLDRLDVVRTGDLIDVIAEARSFLHHQVRNMVGTLKLVGEGSWPVGRVAAALEACDRGAAGPTAPPEGLALTGVRYPVDPFSPEPDS